MGITKAEKALFHAGNVRDRKIRKEAIALAKEFSAANSNVLASEMLEYVSIIEKRIVMSENDSEGRSTVI